MEQSGPLPLVLKQKQVGTNVDGGGLRWNIKVGIEWTTLER